MYIADAIYMVIKDCEIRACNLRGNSLKKFPKKMVTKFPRLSGKALRLAYLCSSC